MALSIDELANEIEAAMPGAWVQVKQHAWPNPDMADSRVLFLAIARGLLTYLNKNQNQLFNSITFSSPQSQTRNVSGMDFNF